MSAAAVLAVALASGAGEAAEPRPGVRYVGLTDPGARLQVREPELLPLSTADAVRYRRIHALQAAGDWDEADALIRRLEDPVLMGEVLAQRYLHPTAYRSSYDELRIWLGHFADHPDAPRIHRLALKRQPKGAPPPPEPVPGYLNGAGQELYHPPLPPYRSTRERGPKQEDLVRRWRNEIVDLVARERPTQALNTVLNRRDVAPLIDRVEYDLARWTIARGYLDLGMFGEALRVAGPAANRSGHAAPEIHWTAGLAAWRLGQAPAAARHFSAMAEAQNLPEADISRAAFWAARAYLVAGKPNLFNYYMNMATRRSHGFYAVLAHAVLGEQPSFQWYEQGLEDGLLNILWEYPGARRALALNQIGLREQAEREIRKLGARADPRLSTALAALAAALDLPAAEMRVAQRLKLTDGGHHHGALFPLPSWQPLDGFRLDRALLYAVARAESGFDAYAESPAGARGLMQLMPATIREAAARIGAAPPAGEELFQPDTNLALGQAYLERLLEGDLCGGNLFYLAAAYNCGPTCLARWRQSLAIEDDPLLFLESLPAAETRAYIKKVMLNLWTYRARLRQASPELADLAENRWPTYRALDGSPRLHARR